MNLHDVLTKHGYTKVGRHTYEHPTGRVVTAGENGKSWLYGHHPEDGRVSHQTGWGHDSLHAWLTQAHGSDNAGTGQKPPKPTSSQHSETEQFGEDYQGRYLGRGGHYKGKSFEALVQEHGGRFKHDSSTHFTIPSHRAASFHFAAAHNAYEHGNHYETLQGGSKTTQHDEEPLTAPIGLTPSAAPLGSPILPIERTEQFEEEYGDSHGLLKEHGYQFESHGSNWRKYKHPKTGHTVHLQPGGHWQQVHPSGGLQPGKSDKGGVGGKGYESLQNQLKKVHG